MSWTKVVDEHLEVVNTSRSTLHDSVEAFVQAASATLESGGKLLVVGNGGSAADAQHFAAELVGRFYVDRAALAAVALTVDTSLLTSVANDYGYERVFARQVEALAAKGDLLVALSTSGNSSNVLEAARSAKTKGLHVVALTGASGGKLVELADTAVRVPSSDVARIQEVHELVLHAVAQALEAELSRG